MRNRYLLWFANEHVDFRLPEITSLLSFFKIDMRWVVEHQCPKNPFWVVEFPNERDARLLAGRSICLRSVLKLWGHGPSLPDLHKSILDYPEDAKQIVYNKEKSFRVNVTTFNRTFTMKEKVAKIDAFDYLPFEGPVKLTSPDHVLHYIEDYGLDPNNAPPDPLNYYFGLWVCDGQRSLINQLSLKTRKFIGNTSMDAQLSVIMANMANARPGALVFDPFVGSGSLLVAAANAGACVLGADIDFLMLHGKTRPTRKQARMNPRHEESILANMDQYGLTSQYVDVIVADSSLPMWRPGIQFDAIITDPPYGVREATERIGSLRTYTIEMEHTATHIPSKVSYSLRTLIQDLLSMAAARLVVGGRLVTWIPVRCNAPAAAPEHPALRLVAVSEQSLSSHTARRLFTYEKISDTTDTEVVIPDIFPEEFRPYNFDRDETRKQKAERRRKCRLERIEDNVSNNQ